MMTNQTLTAPECKVIERATALRRKLYGFQGLGELPNWFARELAAEWRERGIIGVRTACWSLMVELQEVVGSHDLYAEARAIAAGF